MLLFKTSAVHLLAFVAWALEELHVEQSAKSRQFGLMAPTNLKDAYMSPESELPAKPGSAESRTKPDIVDIDFDDAHLRAVLDASQDSRDVSSEEFLQVRVTGDSGRATFVSPLVDDESGDESLRDDSPCESGTSLEDLMEEVLPSEEAEARSDAEDFGSAGSCPPQTVEDCELLCAERDRLLSDPALPKNCPSLSRVVPFELPEVVRWEQLVNGLAALQLLGLPAESTKAKQADAAAEAARRDLCAQFLAAEQCCPPRTGADRRWASEPQRLLTPGAVRAALRATCPCRARRIQERLPFVAGGSSEGGCGGEDTRPQGHLIRLKRDSAGDLAGKTMAISVDELIQASFITIWRPYTFHEEWIRSHGGASHPQAAGCLDQYEGNSFVMGVLRGGIHAVRVSLE